MISPVTAVPGAGTITVVMDSNYPPYTFLDSNGNPQGILIDQWQLWEQKTGYIARISVMDWGEAQTRMDAGEFDVIDTIFYNEERARKYDFSKPYATLDVPLFFHKELSGISGPETVKGFVVAVKSGDSAIKVLESRGVAELREYPSYAAIIEAAKDGEVVVFCIDKPPAMYFLYKSGIRDQFRQTEPLYSGQFHRAVKKGDTVTLDLVERGFDAISTEEYSAIERKWLGTPLFSEESVRIVIGAGLIIILIVVVMVIWNRALKREVTKKTAELQREARISDERAAALSESEEKFRSLYTSMNDMAIIHEMVYDSDGKAVNYRILDCNPRFSALTGVPRESAVGALATEIYGTAMAPYLDTYADVAETGRPGHFETFFTPLGKYLDISVFSPQKGMFITVASDVTERRRAEEALNLARNKLNLLNTITLQDIQNAVFSLSAYLELGKEGGDPTTVTMYREKATAILSEISMLLKFARDYQEMGIKPPRWQDVNQVFILAISHLSLLPVTREISVEGLEIYADPLLETVFFNLVENVLQHGRKATKVALRYEESPRGLLLILEDDGIGIPAPDKNKIFERGFGNGHGLGLLLVREVLSITGISIQETGVPGNGAQFEILIPKGAFRFGTDGRR